MLVDPQVIDAVLLACLFSGIVVAFSMFGPLNPVQVFPPVMNCVY